MSQVESYRGRHADLYDLFYAGKPYAHEAEVVSGLLRNRSKLNAGPMLELACGTGRHAIEFAKMGYDVTGIDYSSDMIRVAKVRTQNSNRVQVDQGDMRKLSFPDQSFTSVVCLFDSIGYLLDNDSILSTLREVRRVIQPNGTFIFEFWHAPAMLRNFDSERTREFSLNQTKVVRTSRTVLDAIQQRATVQYEIFEIDNAGTTLNQFEETQTNRFFQCQEMLLFLTSAGFSNVEFIPAYAPAEAVSIETWHVLALASST